MRPLKIFINLINVNINIQMLMLIDIVEPLICILQYCVYCSLVLEQSTLLYKLIVYSMKYSILQ